MHTRLTILALLLVWPAAAVRGQSPLGKTGEQLVPVSVLADVLTIHPGETFHLAVEFTIEPGWHIYWQDPGSSGLPTEVAVTAPAGYTVGAIRYPRPRAFREEFGVTFGYEKTAMLFVPVTAPAQLADGNVVFRVSASWLVCRKACLMGRAERELSLGTSAEPRGDLPRQPSAPFLEQFARLPRPRSKDAIESVAFDGGLLRITGPARGAESFEFFPRGARGIFFGAPQVRVHGDRYTIEVDVDVRPDAGDTPVLRGLIASGRTPSEPCWEFRREVDLQEHGR